MAYVRIVETGEVLRDARAITELMAPHGVSYEKWDTSRLPAFVREQHTLEAEQQQQVLDLYRAGIARLIAERQYHTADVVMLCPQTPNLDALLSKFKSEHYHTEDEVRFVVDGEGIFFIRGIDQRVYEVGVQPGDLLIVDANTWHWFTLTDTRSIKCVRLFQSTEGWQAIYRETASSRG
ncbi:MAG: cupin domain-containing protein [Candidatus Xenobia bacterium]